MRWDKMLTLPNSLTRFHQSGKRPLVFSCQSLHHSPQASLLCCVFSHIASYAQFDLQSTRGPGNGKGPSVLPNNCWVFMA